MLRKFIKIDTERNKVIMDTFWLFGAAFIALIELFSKPVFSGDSNTVLIHQNFPKVF